MNMKPVQIEGFATIRKDQKELNGGGLLLFIRIHLTFEKFKSDQRGGPEIQAICIRSSKTQWFIFAMSTLQIRTIKLLD